MSDTTKTCTLIEALAELYSFNPRKKVGQEIVFEITDPYDAETDNEGDYLRIGKHWSKFEHKWVYFEHQRNRPCVQDTDRHFVSNFMTTNFAQRCMHYGAQQGTYIVRKITDTQEERSII